MTSEIIENVLIEISMRDKILSDIERRYDIDDPIEVNEKCEKLLRVMCDYSGFEPETIKSASRKRKYVMFRMMYCFIVRNTFNLAFKEIGKTIGGRDHSTVMYNIACHENELRYQSYCDEFKGMLEYIQGRLSFPIYPYDKRQNYKYYKDANS